MKHYTPLRETLLKKGISQRELAKRSGLQESIISLICNGRYIPDKLQLKKIGKVINEPLEEYFDYGDNSYGD